MSSALRREAALQLRGALASRSGGSSALAHHQQQQQQSQAQQSQAVRAYSGELAAEEVIPSQMSVSLDRARSVHGDPTPN
jgi:hypothetical protein